MLSFPAPEGVTFEIVVDNAKLPPDRRSRKPRLFQSSETTSDSSRDGGSQGADKNESISSPACSLIYNSPRPHSRNNLLASQRRRPKFDRWVSDPDTTLDNLQYLFHKPVSSKVAPPRSPMRSNATRPIRRLSNGNGRTPQVLEILAMALEECEASGLLVS